MVLGIAVRIIGTELLVRACRRLEQNRGCSREGMMGGGGVVGERGYPVVRGEIRRRGRTKGLWRMGPNKPIRHGTATTFGNTHADPYPVAVPLVRRETVSTPEKHY